MVIKKPIQFTIVNAVPLISGVAFLLTKVDSRGESAITTIPQKSKNKTNRRELLIEKKTGQSKQQIQDKNNDKEAVLFTPFFSDIYPLAIQAIDPIPIMKKDNNEMFNEVFG